MHFYVTSDTGGHNPRTIDASGTFAEAKQAVKGQYEFMKSIGDLAYVRDIHVTLVDVDVSKAGVLKLLQGTPTEHPAIKEWCCTTRGGLKEVPVTGTVTV